MFNLETMEFEPKHNPDLLFTSQLDFDYDPDADCPVFRNYLNSSLVYPDSTKPDYTLQVLVLEALAYSMTARTDLKASFWLVGQKDSGKSTFVSLLKSLMGSLHATIDLNQLSTNKFMLANIVGKRVVSFTEANSNTMLDDALYKTITGGSDEVWADVKNRDGISFRPECKLWWAMNEMPRMNDRSGATTRRIFIIPFNRTIPQIERIQDLEKRLTQERSGIFNMMIKGLGNLNRTGIFHACEQSEARRREYIMENDTEATFAQECLEYREDWKVKGSSLYDKYVSWCVANGFKAKNANQIAKEWRRLGLELKKSGDSWWHGAKIKQGAPLEF